MRGAISYLDFYLLLSRTERGYRAQVLSSPAGEASSDFVAPFSDLELENFVLRIGRPRRGTRRTGSPEMEAAKTLGKGLYDAVFSGDVKACWSTSLSEAEAQNAGVRLRLRIADAPELNDVPWEYLYNASLNRFLSLSEYTPLIRYLDLPERIRPLPVARRAWRAVLSGAQHYCLRASPRSQRCRAAPRRAAGGRDRRRSESVDRAYAVRRSRRLHPPGARAGRGELRATPEGAQDRPGRFPHRGRRAPDGPGSGDRLRDGHPPARHPPHRQQ
jgi:hypothetical protein